MSFGSLHHWDVLVLAAYFLGVVWIGRRAKSAAESEEGFFLAGRKLGKVYQFFLNFGNATEPQGAISTASFVYQQGGPGAWLSFQTVFTNPYLWFMMVWFRRLRLITVSDMFEDRFGSKPLSAFYALFQVLVAAMFIGFGNVTAYTITSTLAVKQESQWSPQDRASVEGHRELRRLKEDRRTSGLSVEDAVRLDLLRDREARGELRASAPVLSQWEFYAILTTAIGIYIVVGGLAAAATKDVIQSVLMILFSVVLIPPGLAAIGGVGALAERVPKEMLRLFGDGDLGQFTLFSVLGIVLVSIVQNTGQSHNMAICGGARTELAVRWGVAGTYLKRVMIILWSFVGLIGVAMFGVGGLEEPDSVWGEMSVALLGPGFIGLMMAGMLAGTMSTHSAKVIAISSLLVRNVYRQVNPALSERRGLVYARLSIIGVLVLGAAFATVMDNFYDVVVMVLTVNLPFGAVVILTIFWRRLTATAVWWGVTLSTAVTIFVPWTASRFEAIASDPGFAQISTVPGVGVYFSKVVRSDPMDPMSALMAAPLQTNRFNFEAWIVGRLGADVVAMTPAQRYGIQYFFDAAFPFAVLIVASLRTRRSDPAMLARFYGKLKTPVGDTPELEEAAMEATRRDPARFDGTKLLPGTDWEFCRWDRTDAVGFLICTAASGTIIAVFCFALWMLSS